MTGTIYNLSRSQQLDINSKIIAGALLYIYQAGTTTPADTFSDFLLTQLNPWPLESDSSGRFGSLWVADGAYRARMTDSNAILIFDDDNIQAIGPSTGTPVGPGIDPTSVRQTGDFFWCPVDRTRSGAVRANGRTIGSVSSGATERANADTQPLYEFLWNTFSDAFCPVTGGRGVSAVVDFNADKPIVVLSMRGRAAFGMDTMGNSAAGTIVAATSAPLYLGLESKTLVQGNLPSVDFSLASLTGSVSTGITSNARTGQLGNTIQQGTGSTVNVLTSPSAATESLTSGTVTFGGSIPSGGLDDPLPTLSPGMCGTWYVKL